MGKICIACGETSEEAKRPADEPEDCRVCGGEDTMKPEAGEPAERDED